MATKQNQLKQRLQTQPPRPEHYSSKVDNEKHALSVKYQDALPATGLTSEPLQQLGGSGATISRDYTGSKEEKEIATLKFLVKKYEGSGFNVFSALGDQIEGNGKASAVPDNNPNIGLGIVNQIGDDEVLQDFDFDSFLNNGNSDDDFKFEINEGGATSTGMSTQQAPSTTDAPLKSFNPADSLGYNPSQPASKKRRIHVGYESTPEPEHEPARGIWPEHTKQRINQHGSKRGFPTHDEADDDDDDDDDEVTLNSDEEEVTPESESLGRIKYTRKKIPQRETPTLSNLATVSARATNTDSNNRRLAPNVPQLGHPNDATPSPSLNQDQIQYRRLLKVVSRLQQDNKSLKLQISESQLPVWKTLHCVQCYNGRKSIYSDVPVTYEKKKDQSHLQGQDTAEVELFIARQPGRVSFVVFQKYHCCDYKTKSCEKDTITTKHRGTSAQVSTGEEIQIVSQKLGEALEWITERCDRGDDYFPLFDVGSILKAPYFWYYHNRKELENIAFSLTQEQSAEFELFQEYLSQNIGKEYEEVDYLLSNNKITGRYFDYLFSPESLLVMSEPNATTAFVEDTWPNTDVSQFQLYDNGYQVMNYRLKTKAWNWSFDGVFQKKYTQLSLKFETADSGEERLGFDEEIHIHSLPVYPLKYAKPDLESCLRENGEKFWSCRYRNYVAYHGSDYRTDEVNTDTRYMVDLATFYKMHPDKRPSERLTDQLGSEAMARKKAPNGDFLLLLPGKVHWFNMQEKRWVDLQVEYIKEVAWNKEAFTNLVADDDNKELITALVTNQLDAERATDLMSGKGTGLIILLHGGPGTGKTLTAESVAEIAEKPLYRVTCGDIPTAPDEVEKYLETVLLLGKTWGCVVLLDEADVFLEQRTLQNLQRNALVSVFLRVLEYYDGILILTSNRVGTFDEAFKSRIQLALHYENLNNDQRRQIWKIFIKRLEGFEKADIASNELVDTENLRDYLDELSQHNMNGRQIRNAVTTARQLAIHKKEKMDFRHLNHVIKVAQKFDGYLLQVHEGTSDDQIMREDGIR